MKRKRFSVEQIVAVMKQAELIRQNGISEQTFYRWKRQYGVGIGPGPRAQAGGRGDCAVEKLVAELSLDKAVLQDVLSKKFPGQRS
jgi:putative transposase